MDDTLELKFDSERPLALVGLQPEHHEDLQRLLKTIVFGPRFQLLVAEVNDGRYRQKLIERIDEFAAKFEIRPGKIYLDHAKYPDMASLEHQLEALAQSCGLIHIEGGEFWFDIPRWQHFNVRREAIAQSVPVKLVFWLNSEPIKLFIQHAPDCWAWRSGVYSFLTTAVPMAISFDGQSWIADPADGSKLAFRIGELKQALSKPSLNWELQFPLLEELAQLYADAGDFAKALELRHDQQLTRALNNNDVDKIVKTRIGIAIAYSKINQYEPAIAVLENEVLPHYIRGGQLFEMATIQMEIAAMRASLGQIDVALSILQNQVLPNVVQIADQRMQAMVYRLVAALWVACGNHEQARDTLLHHVLPVLQKLGDRRGLADALHVMALSLIGQGEYAEAFRILQEQVLPRFRALHLQSRIQQAEADVVRIRQFLDAASV